MEIRSGADKVKVPEAETSLCVNPQILLLENVAPIGPKDKGTGMFCLEKKMEVDSQYP